MSRVGTLARAARLNHPNEPIPSLAKHAGRLPRGGPLLLHPFPSTHPFLGIPKEPPFFGKAQREGQAATRTRHGACLFDS